MKIQIASDLHNEFGELQIDFSEADLIILAGDIDVGTNGLNWIKEKVTKTPVIYILGNHEYYKKAYPRLISKLKEAAKNTNIHILENESIKFKNIIFHCATLWTDFSLFGEPKAAGIEAQFKMNDYKYIRRSPSYSKIRSIDTFNIHHETVNWLKSSLQKHATKKNIVVTHHAPSAQSIPKEYRNDIVSAAYASNLEDFVLETNPELWIHGHMHNCSDYHIGGTRVICNPRGYASDPDNGFDRKLIIEV